MTITMKTQTDDGTMSNLIQGLKHRLNGNWITDNPVAVDDSVYGDGIQRVTATIEIETLEDPTYAQVYVTAMGWWATMRIVPDLNTLQGAALGEMLAVPEVSTDPSTYTGMFKNNETISVTLTTQEENADIYYTVDGSLPTVGTAKTFKYNGPFTVKTQSDAMNTVTVKAITYKDGNKSFSKSHDIIFLEKETEPSITATEPGVYEVPYTIMKAFEQDYSMANDAVDGNMIVQVYKAADGSLKSNYYMTVKARNEAGIIGHLLQIWNIPGTEASTGAPSDYELDGQKAVVLTTVNEAGLNGNADYPRLLQFTRDSSGEEFFYVRVDVDAMGDTHQSAKVVMDWSNAKKAALPDGVYQVSYSIKKAFEVDYSMANDVIDGPMTVEIKNGTATYTMPVKARNEANIIGHLLQLWNIPGTEAPTGAPSDYEVDDELAKIISTVNEAGLDGTNADYGKVFQFTRSTTGEDFFYIRVNVDAMGNDHQSAKLVPDWSTALFTGAATGDTTVVDKGALLAAVADAEAKDVTKYTEDSVANLNTALAAAKAVLANETATQEEVDQALAALNAAVAALTEATEVRLADGTYTIDGRIWHAAANQASMGNAALKKPMKLIVSTDATTGKAVYQLRMEYVPLTTSGFTGYLAGLNYFPNWEGGESGYEMPTGETPVPATVESYYTGVYDSYNDPTNGSDANIRGKEYPHIMSIPVTYQDNEIWVQVYVPVMEALGEGNGLQYAKLQLDWDTVKEDDGKPDNGNEDPKPGETVDRTALQSAIDTAKTITQGQHTDAAWKTLQDAIAAAKGVMDNTAATQAEVDAAKATLEAAVKTFNDSELVKTELDKNNLADGVYSITGTMVKTDRETLSMSNNAINHTVKLTVKDGKYYLTMNFKGMTVSNKLGYLSQLKYFLSGYTLNKYGAPQGTLADATVDAYQKNADGSLVKDTYGTNYPDLVTFELIPEAIQDGYVPLQVFVPIMEAIAAETGTQPVFLKLDWSTLKATTDDDADFVEDDNTGNGSTSGDGNGNGSGTNGGTTTGGGSLSGGSSLTGGSSLSGSSSLSGGSKLSGGSSLSSGSKLSGGSSLTSSLNGVKTDDTSAPATIWLILAGVGVLAILAAVAVRRRRKSEKQ